MRNVGLNQVRRANHQAGRAINDWQHPSLAVSLRHGCLQECTRGATLVTVLEVLNFRRNNRIGSCNKAMPQRAAPVRRPRHGQNVSIKLLETMMRYIERIDMAAHKLHVLSRIKESGLVAIIRTDDPNQAARIVDACAEAGVTALEITFTVPKAASIIED